MAGGREFRLGRSWRERNTEKIGWVSESESMFVGIPKLKLQGSPNDGWDGSVCNHFPTAVNLVMHTCAVLATSLEDALWHQG